MVANDATFKQDPAGELERVSAVICDMDGVLTDTAAIHAASWKETFDAFLRERAQHDGSPFVEFDAEKDYVAYVDGKPRYDGVRDFLASRGVELPYGDPSDAPGSETVCAVGNRKDAAFVEVLRRDGAQPYPSTVPFIEAMRRQGKRLGVISASRNAEEVLRAAGILHLFDARADGVVAAELGLPGKPAPDVFIEAARQLGVAPGESAIIEDALAGVEAGRRGGFALVVGVDRVGTRTDALRAHGADVVVADLAELVEEGSG